MATLIDLEGKWKAETDKKSIELMIPGIIQGTELGEEITVDTEWVSALHNPVWYMREEYKGAQEEGTKVPFLAQPRTHFTGKVSYIRNFVTDGKNEYTLYIERARWKSEVYVDGVYKGSDETLCASHTVKLGEIKEGKHELKVILDTTFHYGYRPDGHGVSDATGSNWNGMVGEVKLLTNKEIKDREAYKKEYAEKHKRNIEVKDGAFYVDGKPEFFRGTHFGGDYPITYAPQMDRAWWDRLMKVLKEWGLNFIRCHSNCPPDVAFCAADEAGIYIQAECGMWNNFTSGNISNEIVKKETEKILKEYGHHPSFVLFSPSNEPSGGWYEGLKNWAEFARNIDRKLGYENRRVYTLQSGWPYPVPAEEIENTDYLYFHRSGYGDKKGGSIRGKFGWLGKNYNLQTEGIKLPIISHELGQWCAYPDFRTIEKYKGITVGGNLEVFKAYAEKTGVIYREEDFLYCSGKNQMRFYKEDLEASFRTNHIYGFELLDIHDYPGQGSALVGWLDAFWDNKGYAKPVEFRYSCNDILVLAALDGYVYSKGDIITGRVVTVNFKQDYTNLHAEWSLLKNDEEIKSGKSENFDSFRGERGEKGSFLIKTDDFDMDESALLSLRVFLKNSSGSVICENEYEISVFDNLSECDGENLWVCDFDEACERLKEGETVIFNPMLSDLAYDCPPLSKRNVFWNAQMGPNWVRMLGLCINTEHPIFKDFSTKEYGGWQWDDIVESARGFNFKKVFEEGHIPIAEPIDDWNRNFLLSLIDEGKAYNGHLIIVTADFNGEKKDQASVKALRKAITKYAQRGEWYSEEEVNISGIRENLFPLTESLELVKNIHAGNGLKPTYEKSLEVPDPNLTIRYEGVEFPFDIVIEIKEETKVDGIYYEPVQRDVMFEGCPKDYIIEYYDGEGFKEIKRGTFKYSLMSEKVYFEKPVYTSKLKITVLNTFGLNKRKIWFDSKEGWKSYERDETVLQIGSIILISDIKKKHLNENFWQSNTKSATKEIDQ